MQRSLLEHRFKGTGKWHIGSVTQSIVQEAEADKFLDEELPQTIPEIQKEVQELNKESKGLREVMQQPDWNASSPEGTNVTERQEAIMAMRERLQQQMLHIKAGRKIVNRLEATGRARQLVPDSEHITSASAPATERHPRATCARA